MENDQIPEGYRPFYLFDEFDIFISQVYDLPLEKYKFIVDNVMKLEDAEALFDYTASEEYEKGRLIIAKYIQVIES
jgi:hypothetical protein